MQSENQDVRVSVPDRYELYLESKRRVGGGSRGKILPEAGTGEEDTRKNGFDVSYALDANYHKGANRADKCRRQMVAYGTSQDQKINSPDGVSQTLSAGHYNQPKVMVPEATKQGYAVAEEGDSINLAQPNSKTRRGRVGKGIANTVDCGMQQHTLKGTRIRRLTATECMRLMSWPDDWCDYGDFDGEVKPISDTQKFKMAGNGVVSEVVRHVVRELIL